MHFSPVQARHVIGRASFRDPAPALWAGLIYFVGAKVAAVLATVPVPLSNLRPGPAILLAALLGTPPRLWLSILLAVLPVHLFAFVHKDVPLTLTLSWFVGNGSQALLGAAGAAWMLRQPLRLDLLRHAIVFVAWCAFLAPAVGGLLEVAMRHLGIAPPGTFWQDWTTRLVSSAAVILVLVPVRVNRPPVRRLAEFGRARLVEAALLVLALALAGAMLFLGPDPPAAFVPLAAYLPLPLLLWTAIRFGPFGAGFAFLLFSLFVVIGTAFGNGPFAGDAREGAALFLPLFLAGVAVPLLLLCAAVQERRGALAALQQEHGRLALALAAERKRAEHLMRERHARAEVEQRVAERTVALRRANDGLRAEVEGRRQALEAERVALARFSNLFRLSPDAMWIGASVHGPLLDVNEHWQQMFGYPRDAVVGRCADELGLYASPDDAARVAAVLAAQGAVRDLEVRMRSRDGRILEAVVSGADIANGAGACFMAIVRDITEQRRAEAEVQRQREQLTHLSRVVVLGELSGALAHELNQPLAAVLSNAQAARRLLGRPGADLGEIREILDDIVEEDKRAGEVIRRMRALFKKGELVSRPLDASDLVRDTLKFIHSNLVERGVGVRLDLQDALVVRGDRVQLQQVLLNLIVNACDAMRGTPAGRRQLCLRTTALPDARVGIAVADSGEGIAPELAGRIFDPFFTTKTEGLGFGLSISRTIINQHGGRIDAANGVAGGTEFRISLPRYSGEHDV
jgi:two-component system sensor kinase FixL